MKKCLSSFFTSLLVIVSVYFSINTISCLQCFAEYNLATKEEEHLFFSTASEVRLGRALAQKIEKEYKIYHDPKMEADVQRIGQKLASVCDRKDITYCFTVLDEEKENAFSLPGGYIYVNRGLIEKTASDDEIAACLAHEIVHIVARHSIKRLQASLGYNLISILALATTKDVRFKRGTDLAFTQLILGYSREDEVSADQIAVKYLRQAGYDPQAIINFLQKLKQLEKEAPLLPLVAPYARTHPFIPERIAAVKQEIYGKIDFNDYINRRNYGD